MRVSGRFFFIIIIYCSASSCGSTGHFGRHLLSLFGFRISERSALPLRPFVYSPVIIIPTFTQKHNVNIQSSGAEENYQENGDVFQRLTTETDYTNVTNSENVNSDRFSDFMPDQDSNADKIDPREALNSRPSDNTTDEIQNGKIEETTTTSTILETNTAQQVTEPHTEKTKKPGGLYATPKYDNEFIKNLSLTTSAPLTQIKFALPEDNENWKMFTSSLQKNIELYSTNDLLPLSSDNRWSRLPTYNNIAGQFRPIAGLYHDGFLHRPLLNKHGFVPSRQLYEWDK